MKKPSRFLRVVAVLGMMLGLVAVAAPAAMAQTPTAPGLNPPASRLVYTIDGAQEVYFPWVANDDAFGLGDDDSTGADGSVTLQNLSGFNGAVYIYVGTGDGYTLTTTASLAAGASKTFTADDLEIPAPGAPVVAALYRDVTASADSLVTVCEYEVGVDINGDGDAEDCVPILVPGGATLYYPLPIGGVVKSAVEGETLPYTTTGDVAVSGYNGLSGAEVGRDWTDDAFDGLYLPIVQTNCGPGGCWDTRITVSNFRGDLNAAVTIRFFPSDDGSGSLQTGFQVQALLDPGESWQVNLSSYVPEGWVGSAHILSDETVGVIADRFKAGTDMWLTNIGSMAVAEWNLQNLVTFGGNYVLFAPAVYLDYNGWNTGISVANLADADNNINVQYYVNAGNAPSVQTQRLAAHGMTYFYNPSDPAEDDSDQDPQLDRIASAVILSDYPVATAVDAVKYFGNDNNVGQAMSYNATGNLFEMQSMPLVQKGNPATGMGATSGLHLLNPTSFNNEIDVYWLNQSGFNASNFGVQTVIVPPAAIGFAYSMTNQNIPNGYYGSAIAESVNEIPFAMTSANVDYQVQGDGSVIWNGYNPCGLFRQVTDDCFFLAPVPSPEPEPEPETGFLEKTFVDAETGAPISDLDLTILDPSAEAAYEIGSPNSAGFVRTELSAGEYELCWVAQNGILPGDPGTDDDAYEAGCEPFEIVAGEVTTLTNELEPLAVLDACVQAVLVIGFPVEGVQVTVTDAETLEVVGVGSTDAEGHVDMFVPAGTYFVTAQGGLYVDPATGDTVPLSDETVLVTIAAGDDDDDFLGCDVEIGMLPLTDGNAAFFTKTVTVDGEPAEGLDVALYGVTTNSAGDTVCNFESVVGFGLTDEDGEVTFAVEGEQVYCLQVETLEPEIITIPTGDSDLLNELTAEDLEAIGLGVLDITAAIAGDDDDDDAPVAATVTIYEAEVGDSPAAGCVGTVEVATIDLDVDGTGSVILDAGTYCIEGEYEDDDLTLYEGAAVGVTVTAGATTTATVLLEAV